jgi:hypothetical protein
VPAATPGVAARMATLGGALSVQCAPLLIVWAPGCRAAGRNCGGVDNKSVHVIVTFVNLGRYHMLQITMF